MKVTQHIPSFIDLEAPRFEGDIASISELTQCDWVAKFWAAPGFYQFSRSPYPESGSGYLLMAEFEGGARAYVVARLEGEDAGHLTRVLPEWK